MRIDYFEVDGFKNTENAHIDLTDITALMALNSKGKSNLLKGILFGLLIIESVPETRNAIYHSYDALSKPLADSSEGKDYRFEIGGKTFLEGEEIAFSYSF
ncbi:MAG: hypothetical protein J5736_04370, partial [Bacilli bacterium]|nr:hypothetical protein [Bacilli bacterium]